MKLSTVTVTATVLIYHAMNTKGFGVPYIRCTLSEQECYEEGIEYLDTMEDIDTVYLDFDKTITINGYSEDVREELCGKGYPEVAMSPTEACNGFDANFTGNGEYR